MSLADQLKDPNVTPNTIQARDRRVVLTRLDTIKTLPVSWVWHHRMAAGMFGLFAGREGLGKSLVTTNIAAQITRGTLDGQLKGVPRKVIICATEDSFAHTIVPRMMAANADLKMVARVDVQQHNVLLDLTLPIDLPQLADEVRVNQVALIILDPLISRLSVKLDTHKDSDVRQALEPFVKLADSTGAAVLGIIHLNKGSTTDANNQIMGSRAFSSVARYTLFVTPDPNEEKQCLLGQSKNNVGPSFGLPLLPYRIEPYLFTNSDDVTIETARIAWQTADTTRTLNEVLKEQTTVKGRPRAEAERWLHQYLESHGRSARPRDVKAAAEAAGHVVRTVERAARTIGVLVRGGGQATLWELPPC